jgi:hypothetical protein
VLTGRTIRSGFPCAPPTPSPLAVLRIISLACFRLAPLSAPIWPSWIRARLNGLKAGAGGMVDINAKPLKVTGRTRIGCRRRDSNNVFPRQQNMVLKTRLDSEARLGMDRKRFSGPVQWCQQRRVQISKITRSCSCAVYKLADGLI